MKYATDRLRKSTGDPKFFAPLDRREGSLTSSILISCYTPFRKSSGAIFSVISNDACPPELLLFDRMALLLDSW